MVSVAPATRVPPSTDEPKVSLDRVVPVGQAQPYPQQQQQQQAFMPPVRRRDPVWAWLFVVFGALLVFASGGLFTTGELLVSRYESSVKKETLLSDEARVVAEPGEAPDRLVGPLNYLLLGSDIRSDSPEDGQRSDTIIIAHIPASLDRVYLISVPRDLRVHIPAFQPTGFHGSREKVNAAFQYGGGGNGGVQLMSSTLSELLGIKFDGAVVVDFTGFQSVVKALDGVEMCIDHRVESEHMGFDKNGKYLHPHDGGTPVVYEPGCRMLNDWEALDYVRQRYSLPDGDYGRQRHQQQFLQAILVRAREKGLATNPVELDRLIRAVAGTLTVDTNGVPLKDLVFGLRDIGSNAITGITIPSEPAWIGNTSYVVAFDEAAQLYEALANDTMEDWLATNAQWVNQL